MRQRFTTTGVLPLFFARGAGGAFHVAHAGWTLGALGMDIYRFGRRQAIDLT